MTTTKGVGPSLIAGEEIPGVLRLSDITLHNRSAASGTGSVTITTPAERWAYAATFPLCRLPAFAAPKGVLLIRVEVQVHHGRIGIGCVSPDLRTYVVKEKYCSSEDGRTVVELSLEDSRGPECGWLVVRNSAEGNQSSRVTVRSIRTFWTSAPQIPDLVESELVLIPRVGPAYANRDGSRYQRTRKFCVALTHTSRKWDWERCTREDISRRYSDPKRLHDLMPFENLPPPTPPEHSSSGKLSLLELTVGGDGAGMIVRRSIDSPFKIQHVNTVGGQLVLCFENFLAVLPRPDTPVENVDLRPGSRWRIDDNWFSGLHTVFPVTEDICLVSSSGSDAVLWVDLRSRKVIRRWRLPSEIYGVNYELTPGMSVSRHYIHNDIQLGHLNCAYPDGRGGCYVSTLGQGHIGHVDENGKFSLLARGYVGCHGVRVAQNGRDVYFSDSCSGRLMRLEPDGCVRECRAVNSRWLHDVEQADSDLYVFCLGDRNEVAVVDVTSGEEQGRFAFDVRGVNVQFVSILGSLS